MRNCLSTDVSNTERGRHTHLMRVRRKPVYRWTNNSFDYFQWVRNKEASCKEHINIATFIWSHSVESRFQVLHLGNQTYKIVKTKKKSDVYLYQISLVLLSCILESSNFNSNATLLASVTRYITQSRKCWHIHINTHQKTLSHGEVPSTLAVRFLNTSQSFYI